MVVRSGHVSAPAGAPLDLDQSQVFERPHRLTHRDPAGAELLDQLALRGQLVARLELARKDRPLDLTGDFFGDSVRGDAVEHAAGITSNIDPQGLSSRIAIR